MDPVQNVYLAPLMKLTKQLNLLRNEVRNQAKCLMFNFFQFSEFKTQIDTHEYDIYNVKEKSVKDFTLQTNELERVKKQLIEIIETQIEIKAVIPLTNEIGKIMPKWLKERQEGTKQLATKQEFCDHKFTLDAKVAQLIYEQTLNTNKIKELRLGQETKSHLKQMEKRFEEYKVAISDRFRD